MAIKRIGIAQVGTTAYFIPFDGNALFWFFEKKNYSQDVGCDNNSELIELGDGPNKQEFKKKTFFGLVFDEEQYLRARRAHLDKREQIIQRLKEEGVKKALSGLAVLNDGKDCIYKGTIFSFDRVGYTEEEMLLQIMELEDKERQKFERLKHKFSQAAGETSEISRKRIIPEEVRVAVWRRDEGKCAKCSSREFLEYDHIVPFSKGGSNTVRNIELLCEKCNREKRDHIQ